MYVFKALWPIVLAPIYPHPGATLTWFQIVSAFLFLSLVTAMVWHFRRSRPYLVTGWLWFLGTLVPVIGLVQVGAQAMADRYAYVPFIGIFLMLVWGAADLAYVRRARSSFRVASVLAIGLLCVLSWRQIQYWKTPYDIWSHTLAVTTNNYIAEDNLATSLLRMGNIEAVAHFQNASRLAPNDPVSHGALAGLYQDQGRFEEAIAYYQIAIRGSSDPDMLAVAEANLAIIYRQTGEYQKARDTYRLAARSSPQALVEMIESLNGQLARQPAAQGYLRLGLLLDVADRIPEARAAYQQALLLDPGLDQARKALASLG
jgi:tetratricopeptide (TPR) repeat protein